MNLITRPITALGNRAIAGQLPEFIARESMFSVEISRCGTDPNEFRSFPYGRRDDCSGRRVE